jgi:hypothetical protein
MSNKLMRCLFFLLELDCSLEAISNSPINESGCRVETSIMHHCIVSVVFQLEFAEHSAAIRATRGEKPRYCDACVKHTRKMLSRQYLNQVSTVFIYSADIIPGFL